MDTGALERTIAALEAFPAEGGAEAFRARRGTADALAPIRERLAHGPSRRSPLARRADALATRLEAADAAYFERVRAGLREGSLGPDALRAELDLLTAYRPSATPARHLVAEPLDAWLAGLLAAPRELEGRTPGEGLVHYEPAPASAILELADVLPLARTDVVLDVGSGAGHVPILLHLLTGATTQGIELEPSVAAAGRAAVDALGLARVALAEGDARTAAYEDASVFFFFTPFLGTVLDAVLDRIEDARRGRDTRIVTYGPCTPEVARRRTLRLVRGDAGDEFGLAVFTPIPM